MNPELDATILESGQASPRPAASHTTASPDYIRRHIRGSSLLLAGKVVALGLNFLAHLALVRYFSASDFGAFAYTLAVASFFQHVSTLGLRTGLPRFVPIYHERGLHDRLFGAVIAALATALLASGVIVAVVQAAPHWVSYLLGDEGRNPVFLLRVMIFVVPLMAMDDLCVALFAAFGRSRAVFLRVHIAAPALKVIAVLLTVLLHQTVSFLAVVYLLAFAVGTVAFVPLLARTLRPIVRENMQTHRLRLPLRELFAFSLPLLGTDLLVALAPVFTMLLLGYYHDLREVAIFAAVLPIAHLNRVVRMSFETLYAPTAARLFARGDMRALDDLYRRTSRWMTLLSLPIFLVTGVLAQPLLLFLFGSPYGQAWTVLAPLAFGYFVFTALGLNSQTLQIVGKVRQVVLIDVAATAAAAALALLLIPPYGAIGAALAKASALVIQSAMRHAALVRNAGIVGIDRRLAAFYGTVLVVAGALFAMQWIVSNLALQCLLVVAATALLIRVALGHDLKLAETFPELLSLPLVPRLLNSLNRRWSDDNAPPMAGNAAPVSGPDPSRQDLRPALGRFFANVKYPTSKLE